MCLLTSLAQLSNLEDEREKLVGLQKELTSLGKDIEVLGQFVMWFFAPEHRLLVV